MNCSYNYNAANRRRRNWCDLNGESEMVAGWGIQKRTHENPFRFSAKIQIHWEITNSQYSELCHRIHTIVWFYWLRVCVCVCVFCVCSFYEFTKSFSESREQSIFWIQREQIASNGVLNHSPYLSLSIVGCVFLAHSNLQSPTNFISLVALWWNQFECVCMILCKQRMNLNV